LALKRGADCRFLGEAELPEEIRARSRGPSQSRLRSLVYRRAAAPATALKQKHSAPGDNQQLIFQWPSEIELRCYVARATLAVIVAALAVTALTARKRAACQCENQAGQKNDA